MSINNYIAENKDRFLSELLDLLRIPSISANPAHKEDMLKTAEFVANSLKKAGRSDVIFQVHGYGEDTSVAPFENKLPEGRFYNRTVIIDIIP